jgi:hypothetical protein
MDSTYNVHPIVHFTNGPFLSIYRQLHDVEKVIIWLDQCVIKVIDYGFKVVSTYYCNVKQSYQPLKLVHSDNFELMAAHHGGAKYFL